MYIDDVQSVFTPGVVQNKQQNRQDVRAAASGRAPVGDTVSFSAEALELARSKAAAENSVQKREGESVLPQAEEANEAQARGSKSGKSLVSLMLDAMFMFALEEEEAEPSPLTRGDGETSEDASSPVTDNKPAEAQKLMDGMVQGKFDLSEMVDALAGLSSAKGVSGSTGQGAIRDKSDARGKPAE